MAAERTAHVALGANLGAVTTTLRRALQSLDTARGCRLTAVSRWYRSRALGPGAQPDYLNGVAAVSTTLAPLALLEQLQSLEADAGRVRAERWAPRTLDLDLLLYDDLVLDDTRLTLPHPRLAERAFVVWPLSDVAPALALPDGTRVAALRERLDGRGIVATFASLDQADD
jgi:2-amino-4-hydroxy-6-hydroxymethyldihydropteridine diphosphokinase